ncbi:hypothetical protein BAE29_09550 [Acidithiobacillus caldus]|uniref:Uncharacterized protein n=3 Tax=Acidithiobacillus caldus TaxID=33059 RepID=A0A1E7YP05_9PROT|nr:hypothetical protein BAE28_12585 [Acidithiobacillus caldus]OFC36777.1 hypothetical protein BAE27_05270 [Acidithiobacillus caldus]OFC37988.1 hypothetical protein BAE29_09550 [Acidithiobacillus caldus]
MRYCGMNIGYGYTKMHTDASYFQIASVVERARTQNMGGVSLVRETVPVNVDGHLYEVGADAHQISESRNSSKAVADAWFDTVQYRALMQMAIDRMAQEFGADEWSVTLGMAVNQYKRKEIRKKLETLWKGEHLAASGDTVRVKLARVVPEPLGAYTWWLQRECDEPLAESRRMRVMVLDPGYRTFDWLEVIGGRVIDRHADAINVGMYDVYRDMQERILDAKDAELDIVAIEQAVVEGKPIRVRGEPLDHQLYFKASLQAKQDLIETRIRTEIGPAPEADLILIAGGGAQAFAPAVKRAFPKHRVEVCPLPQEANAKGYWLLAGGGNGG